MSTPLRREIGLLGAVMLVIGGIVGAGIFRNPAVVASQVHSPVLILGAWAVGGFVALLGSFVYAELAERMPETGGEYAYLRDTYGPVWGFMYGWTTLLVVQTGGMAAVTIVFAGYFNTLTGLNIDERLIAVAVLSILCIANCVGVKTGNGVQTAIGIMKVVAIAGLVLAGLFLIGNPHPLLHPVLDRPVSTGLFKSFGGALIPVVFAFGGWQTANFVAGEIKDPRRNLALALLVGVLAVITLYLSVNIACLRGLGAEALGKTTAPAADVLTAAIGPAGGKVAAALIALSALGYLSQTMLTGPRVYYAMAKDGLFFRQLASVTEGGASPAVSIIVQTVWTIILALSGRYDQILSYVVAMNFLFFGVSASCLFVLRRRERRAGAAGGGATGFRAPWHPLTTGLFILFAVVIVISSFWSKPIESLIGYGIMIAGVPPYLYWRRKALAAKSAVDEPAA
jgi:APA family basic amino acid/polyamine antiporter